LNTVKITAATWKKLEAEARAAATHSYSPYSKFRVGAAILTGSGKVYSGANIENASYGLCNCAERSAIFTAASKGERELRAVVVYTPTKTPTAPCGACRQVINEFGPYVPVISVCDSQQRVETTSSALLPGAFGPASLGVTRS
jgi:cytidine deaminase